LAVVILTADSSGRSISLCTNPLPKDLLPITIPRSQSCTAPVTISLADADPSSISIMIFAFSYNPDDVANILYANYLDLLYKQLIDYLKETDRPV
jgi:hypothetical protein